MGDLKTVEENLLKVQTNLENNLSVVAEKQATSLQLRNKVANGVNMNNPMIKVAEVVRLIGIHGTEFIKHVPEVWGVPDGEEYIFVANASDEDWADKTNIDNNIFHMHPQIPLGKTFIEIFGDRDNATYKAIQLAVSYIDGEYPDYKLISSAYEWPPGSGTEKIVVATRISKDGFTYSIGSGVNKM